MSYYTRAANTYINTSFSFPNSIKCSCHKWIIFYSISKNYKLSTTNSTSISSTFS